MAIERRGQAWHVRVYNRTTRKRDWIDAFRDEDYGGKKQSLLAAQKAEIEAKDNPIAQGRETCESFALRWTTDYCTTSRSGSPRWGEKTIRDMNGALKPFIASFGPRRLNSLSIPEARSWAQGQPAGYTKVVRTMLNDAVRDGLIQSNPFSNLRLEQSRGRADIIVLTEPEVEGLCDLALEVWPEFGLTFAAMIATAAYTAIRPGELFALKPENIRPADMELDVMRSYNGVELKLPKNGKPREGIILPPQASARIEQMPRKLNATWLFETPRGGRFRKSKLSYYWDPVRRAAGRDGMDWYELRHAGCTLLIERGNDPQDVAWQMGHGDSDLVEKLYGHPRDEWRRERIKRTFREPAPLEAVRERKAENG